MNGKKLKAEGVVLCTIEISSLEVRNIVPQRRDKTSASAQMLGVRLVRNAPMTKRRSTFGKA